MLFDKSVKITATTAATEEEFDNFICSTPRLTMYASQRLPFIAFAQCSSISFVSKCCQQLRCDKLVCGTWRTRRFTQKALLLFEWCFSIARSLLSYFRAFLSIFSLHTILFILLNILACISCILLLPKHLANAWHVRSGVNTKHAIIFW